MKKIYAFVGALLCSSFVSFAQRLANESSSQHIDSVYAYEYAPGQHALNYTKFADKETNKNKFIGDTGTGYVLLGGWGGYISGGFDHSVMNRHGYDFGVYSQPGAGDEPGVVYVMQDENNNQKPDDTWYELRGNVVDSAGYISNYQVTYYKPETAKNGTTKVRWVDNRGNADTLNMAKWWDDSKDSIIFTGAKLPNNKENTSGPFWYDIKGLYTEGYAEVYSANDYNKTKKYNQFDISNAMDSEGNTVELEYVDFIKVQTGCFYEAGWLGEVSTEVSGAVDMNIEDFAATFEEIELDEDTFTTRDINTIGLYETASDTLYSGSFSFGYFTSNWGTMTSWGGVAVSNKTDTTTLGGVNNQYNSAASGDAEQNGNYAVIYDMSGTMGPDYGVKFDISGQPEGKVVSGCYVTNNTYVTNSLENGDGFAKKFGGNDGNDEDWFVLRAYGVDYLGNNTDTLDFYLADFRFENSRRDYIVKDWAWFDLSALGKVNTVHFIMNSSDVGTYGVNTPTYFCMDNLAKQRIEVGTALEDIEATVGDDTKSIDLSSLFNVLDDSYGKTTNTVLFNSAENYVSASITDNNLEIDFLKVGESTIIIKGKYKGMMITDTINVTVKTSVATSLVPETVVDVNVFPNPSNGIFNINTGNNDAYDTYIYTMNGQIVLCRKNNVGISQINISELNSGQYIVKMVQGNSVNTTLITKK